MSELTDRLSINYADCLLPDEGRMMEMLEQIVPETYPIYIYRACKNRWQISIGSGDKAETMPCAKTYQRALFNAVKHYMGVK